MAVSWKGWRQLDEHSSTWMDIKRLEETTEEDFQTAAILIHTEQLIKIEKERREIDSNGKLETANVQPNT